MLLQKEDLREILVEIVEEIVGKARQAENRHESDEKWLTRDEVCNMLRITLTTLWRMEKRGEITSRKIGRRNLYLKTDVDSLINN